MSRLLLAALFCTVLATIPGITFAGCKDRTICIDEIRTGNIVELRARNLRKFPITYTLRVYASGFSVAGPKTVTRTLNSGETQRIMLLSAHRGTRKGRVRYRYKWTVGRKDAKHNDSHLYALPYGAEKSYPVLQGYGPSFSHRGNEKYAVDFNMRVGTPIHAARSGVVARIEESNTKGCWNHDCGQFANFIVILHADGTTGEYYHLKKGGAFVEAGDRVIRGQEIGLSGNTGHTTMPHLHFAVYRAVDWGRTQSIAVRFQSADGIIRRPRRGARYRAL